MDGTPCTYSPSALYVMTGMPSFIAVATGVVNAVLLIAARAMPSALAATAVLK